MDTQKICTLCKTLKNLNDFTKQKVGKLGLSPWCRDCKNTYQKKYRLVNFEKVKNSEIKYSTKPENKNKRLLKRKIKYHTNIQENLAIKLRRRFKIVLREGFVKYSSAIRDLGCSLDEFKIYFESKFTVGMSWDKVKTGEIHIDHIIPLCKFNLVNPEEQLKAVHYTNLQPLWAKDNLIKSGY